LKFVTRAQTKPLFNRDDRDDRDEGDEILKPETVYLF
jgi:hypothetical protein